MTLLVVLAAVSPALGTSLPPYSTKGFVAIGATETTQAGTKGVIVNYNNTLASPVVAFVYIVVTNSVGQTVFVQVNGGVFSAGENKTIFFGMSGMSSGTYSATLFVASANLVPLSVASSVQVVL